MLKDMQNIKICVECSKDNPSYLEQTGKVDTTGEKTDNVEEMFNDVKDKSCSVNEGLLIFQLKPKGPKDEELFQYMINYREMHRKFAKKSSKG